MTLRLSDLLLNSQSDERLVSLARAGHERAFAAIVERYRPELQAMARRLCSDGRSEDVVQQAFLSAFTALSSGCEVRHLRGWLYQIVRNTAGRSQAPACLPLDCATTSANVVEEVVQQRVLAMTALSEIARLPASQRQAMIGTALDGRARAEIARSMGLSEGAVRQLVHRARTTLRGAMTALTPWPLARLISAAGPDAPGPAELAAGAGAASSGGAALKLGALIASGTLLTGAAVHLQARPSHRGDARAQTSVHARGPVARAHPVEAASVTAPLSAGAAAARHAATAAHGASRSVAYFRVPLRLVHRGRHGGAPASSGGRSRGLPGNRRGDGRGSANRTDGAGSRGGHDGAGSLRGSGSGSGSGGDGQRGTSGSGGGTHTDGTGGSGTGSRTGTDSSSGGDAQMASVSPSFASSTDASGTHTDSGSGDGSSSGTAFQANSGSGSGTGGDSSGDSGSGAGLVSGGGGGTSGG